LKTEALKVYWRTELAGSTFQTAFDPTLMLNKTAWEAEGDAISLLCHSSLRDHITTSNAVLPHTHT